MTLQAHHGGRLQQVGVVGRAVNIMATEAGDSAPVHHAGRKIVALHPILVRGAIGEVSEGRFAKLMILEFPIIIEL